MINWIEINKDSLLGNILVTLLFIPIAYVFTVAMDSWKKRKKGYRDKIFKKEDLHKAKKRNTDSTKQRKIENEKQEIETKTIKEKTIVYIERENRNSDDNSTFLIFGIILILAVGVWLLNTYKDIISNTIYLISLFGLILNLIFLGREIKYPSTKDLTILLSWSAFLWLCLMALMHLLYHPRYLPEEAITALAKIHKGSGVLSGGIEGFTYLANQFVGLLFCIVILLFNIMAQIYTYMAWWNESSVLKYSLKNKIMNTIIKLLERFFQPIKKYVIISVFLLLLAFIYESGLVSYFIKISY